MKETIAYKGPAFTIEWYHNENGNSQPLDYFNNLTIEEQAEALVLFKRMGDAGKINNTTKFRNEGDKIFAFKPKPNRFLCFFCKW